MRSLLILAVAGSLVIISSGSWAHMGATGIVKQRMDSMKLIAKDVKALKKVLQASGTLDIEEIKRAATEIRKHAREIPALFPKGSFGHPSEANRKIWEEFRKFEQEAEVLAVKAEQLLSTVVEKPDVKSGALRPVFGEITQTCKSCHSSYRTKR